MLLLLKLLKERRHPCRCCVGGYFDWPLRDVDEDMHFRPNKVASKPVPL